MEQLGFIRRTYREHLARYAWARWLKGRYLAGRVGAIEARNRVLWQTHLRLAKGGNRLTSAALGLAGESAGARGPSAGGRLGQLLARGLYKLLTGESVRFFRLLPLRGAGALAGVEIRPLLPARTVDLTLPEVLPVDYRGHLHAGRWPLAVPRIDAVRLADVELMGGSDLLYVRDACLHHGLYDFARDQLPEQVHGVVHLNASSGMVVRLRPPAQRVVEEALSLVGSVSSNYIHWLTENLPKLAVLQADPATRGLPLLVDKGLHPNLLRSLRVLDGQERPLIEVAKWEVVRVHRLVTATPVSYVPFEFQPQLQLRERMITPDFALYSPDALDQVRRTIVARLADPAAATGRRLYLRRGAKSRPMANAAEVEALVRSLGFEVVDPGTLDFDAQVQLFSGASVVVGQGGAAFGNILFAPPGCHVVILTTWSPYTIHYYFANIASVLGQRCTLVMCDPVDDDLGEHRAHKGLRVPTDLLRSLLEP